MISRNAAVRLGHRTLAAPVSRSSLRTVTTQTRGKDESKQQAAPKVKSRLRSRKRKLSQEVMMRLTTNSSQQHRGSTWTLTREFGQPGQEKVLTPAQQFAEFNRLQNLTVNVGTKIERRYNPTLLLRDLAAPEDVTLELLMASQTHMGHAKENWNPANSRYIYGVRQGIHIISLETTLAHLRRAARVVEETCANGGLVLFVGTRRGQMEIVTQAAKLAGSFHLFTKWSPGTITNRDVMLGGHPLHVVDPQDKKLDGFDTFCASMRPRTPDLVVCLNPLENYTMLYECGLTSVPTIGVIDTDADPSWVTYTIPANDDSHRSIAVIAGALGRAGQRGQKRRLEAAEQGKVTWTMQKPLGDFLAREARIAKDRQKEVMGRVQAQLEGFTEEEQKVLHSRFPQEEEMQVGEDEMIGMMGEAASGEAATSDLAAALAAEQAVERAAEEAAEEMDTDNSLLAGVGEGLEDKVQSMRDSMRAQMLMERVEEELSQMGQTTTDIATDIEYVKDQAKSGDKPE